MVSGARGARQARLDRHCLHLPQWLRLHVRHAVCFARSKKIIRFDARHCELCNLIECMFVRFKEARHVATLNDRCLRAFLSAIALAGTLIFWLCTLSLGHA